MAISRRSENPPPVVESVHVHTKTAKGAARQKTRGLNRQLRRLLVQFNTSVPDDVRTFLRKALTSETAVKNGRRRAPMEYCVRFIEALKKFSSYVESKRLPGYGPMRARYGLELVREALPLLSAMFEHEREQSAASQGQRGAIALTDAQRTTAKAAFTAVLAGDATSNVSLAAIDPKSSAAHARIVSAEELAAEVERVQGEVPAALLDDAGLSQDVLDAMHDNAGAASDAGDVRDEKAAARQLLRARLAEPCGRIELELRVLLGAARAARKKDATVPRFAVNLVSHTASRKAPATPDPVAPAAAPTNG